VPTHVHGDIDRLRQVLVNLLGNALKFTKAGEVSVRAQLLEDCGEQLLLRFGVRDTGIGIPADKLGQLFEKFSQLDTSSTRKFGGTGLGLAISKKLAQLMDGDIGVTSEFGHGSEFWFTARLTKVGSAAIKPRATLANETRALQPETNGCGANARVLLVEDNTTNQLVALAILHKLGIRVDAVGDGKEAISSLRSIPYSLVLMDVQMPVMDGLEATRVIRSGEGGVLNPRVPIIAMTANAMQGDREKCLAAGMDDYVPKPVTASGLASVVAHWLSTDCCAESRLAQVVPSSEPGVFDEPSLLARVSDDQELARTVVLCFLEDLPKQLAALSNCVACGDAKGAQRQVHTIRGAAAAVSGTLLIDFASALEDHAAKGNLAAVGAALGELSERFSRVRSAMLSAPGLGLSATPD
jgi:CheY-like chemotaxis protein/HPt (histidine-containing phosphotransfer) domain-containing protein